MKILARNLGRAEKLLLTLGFSSLVSIGLLVTRMITNGNTVYLFLVWNLFLAWLPLSFAAWLRRWMLTRHWWSWQGISLTLLWLLFLPNTFYIISDVIHLQTTAANSVLFDAAMLLSFVWNGLLLGYCGLYFMHRQLLLRLKRSYAHAAIGFILLLCSFAIYLGRYLRWNTWDIIVNPAGLLFDVSDRAIHPSLHPGTYTTTITFFVLLTSMYAVVWNLVKILDNS